MFPLKLTVALCVAGLSSLCAASTPATETPAQALSRVLDANRTALTVSDQGLSGPAAAKLVDAGRRAEFILVGEDHGFVEVPQFVVALQHSLGADAPSNLVLEIGPLAAARLAEAARNNQLDALSHQYPAELPFFDWSGDGAMAAAWQQKEKRTVLWGIDQEFILSSRLHFERLEKLNPREPAHAVVVEFLQRAQAAEKKMVTEHDPSAALLPQLMDADFKRLRDAIKPAANSESANILDELAQSAEIYRGQETDGYGSNHQRSLLMKRNFMAYYNDAQKQNRVAPRAMFRLGAFHAGRGLNVIGQLDIGNMASEIAASHGKESLHILVIAAGGSVNKWLPFIPDTSLRAAPYNAREELAQLQATSFIDHALSDTWTVFDLSAFRRSHAAREGGGALFERLVYGYDYVIVIPQAHAALDYPATNTCGTPGAPVCRIH
ncbi:hypothetical protein ELE36_17150 [Pseudolysobacter antarcticus]|uniref:Haem-binding uptake Tiki superfamily ChaN domain-containing protein n=1 Tax=Pseudolysobacter antarcticus TaxID=2511995 RepID=A0A411HN93_9GAMM|nr:hypothetical protein [Pseudolysobacter antarcticus]QBB71948.1 hypothetical protein ELE36_17150 [Pseudolysobacter antarcticus]